MAGLRSQGSWVCVILGTISSDDGPILDRSCYVSLASLSRSLEMMSLRALGGSGQVSMGLCGSVVELVKFWIVQDKVLADVLMSWVEMVR